MRWKRGLFRLWVVVAGLWVIGALVIGFKGIGDPGVHGRVVRLYPVTQTHEITKEVVYNWSLSTPAAPVGFENAVYDFDGTKYCFQFPIGTLPGFKGADWIKNVAGEVEDDRKRRRWEARFENIQLTAAGALIPPTIVLAIGTAFAWAFSGFSRKDSAGNE